MSGTQFSLFFFRFPLMSDVHVTYHCVLICFLTFAVNLFVTINCCNFKKEMSGEYEEKKAAYENLAAGLESNMSKLEQVRKLCLSFSKCQNSVTLIGMITL